MTILINKTIVMKICRKEYELLLFIRNKMPYGRCVLITKDGRPVRIERAFESIVFGVEQKSEPVDNL